MSEEAPQRREHDELLCRIAFYGRGLWDWIDRRQLDAWMVLGFSLWMTYAVLDWAMQFADAHPEIDALRIAAVVGAVVGPWVTMQAALVKFVFDARQKTFLPPEKV